MYRSNSLGPSSHVNVAIVNTCVMETESDGDRGVHWFVVAWQVNVDENELPDGHSVELNAPCGFEPCRVCDTWTVGIEGAQWLVLAATAR